MKSTQFDIILPTEIEVGSRVRILKESLGYKFDEQGTGTVICLDAESIGVSIDNCNIGHTLSNRLNNTSGWWFNPDELKLIL